MPENNQIMSVSGQLVGLPLAGPESFSQQQLDYLKRALGVDETVLWSGSEKTTSASITLSEPIENFERFAVYGIRANTSLDRAYQIREFGVNNGALNYAYPNFINIESNTLTVDYMYLILSGTTVSILAGCRQNGSTYSNNITSYNFNLVKIVGIHRISGGN